MGDYMTDALGKKFGRLTVIGFVSHGNGTIWVCRCQCGTIVERQPGSLLRSKMIYASCKVCRHGIEVGGRYGLLLVLERTRNSRRGTIWTCRCDCGEVVERLTYHLKDTEVPGCSKCESFRCGRVHITHGELIGSCKTGKATRLYKIWGGMLERCSYVGNKSHRLYGAKGIRVCEDWHDFAKFREWATANGYANNLTIERRDSNKNYDPSNCEWVTKQENSKRAGLKTGNRHRLLARLDPLGTFPVHTPIEMLFGFV